MIFKGGRQVSAIFKGGKQVVEAYKGGRLVFCNAERHHRHAFRDLSGYYTRQEIDEKFDRLERLYGEGGTPQLNVIDLNDSGRLIYETILHAPQNSIWVGMDGDKKYSLNIATIGSRKYSISYFTGITTEYIDVTADGDKDRRFVKYYSIN